MNVKMKLVSLDQQNNHGIMDEENHDSDSSDILSNFSSSDSELLGEEEEGEGDSSDPTSPNSSSSGDSISHDEHTKGALQNMSTLLQELPFKRGLSKHYNGKSQSFTSLSNVRSLEDMAKPENPYNKKLKSCKSYGVFLEGFKSDNLHPPIRSNSSSRLSSKRGSCSSLRAKRNGSFLGNNSRPPAPPHRSTSTTSFTTQTPLFA
ncbi:uncharacterized protein LOC125860670 [Solanum stenotomum]|uniref:uncharacterized protein LOC125860670 n=1 Tax=Solanum stenotomum TaxID=172797 RepID=UPI0020D19AC3|nr:uncharacterized protein LOC125860670 [Solanum stenotomum]